MGFLQRSLRARLLAYFLLIAVISLSVIGYTAYTAGKQAMMEHVKYHLSSVATLKENAINDWLSRQRHEMEERTENPAMIAAVTALMAGPQGSDEYLAARQTLAEEVREMTALESMYPAHFIDAETGTVLVSSDPGLEGASLADADYFLGGRAGLFVSDARYSSTLDRSTLVVSAPVRDSGGRVTAVLAGHVALERLNEAMQERSGLGETGETFLVNSDGVPVTPTVYRPEATLASALSDEGISRALAGDSDAALYTRYTGVPAVGAYRWIPVLRLGLVVEQDQAEAFGLLQRVRLVTSAGAGIMVLLVAAACIMVAHLTTTTLARLTRFAHKIEHGDYGAELDVKGRDEVAEVSTAIKAMVERLLASQKQLQIVDSAVRSASDGLSAADLNGNLTYVNPAFVRMYGYGSEREMLGTHISTLASLPEQANQVSRRLLQTREGLAAEVVARRKDGSEFIAEMRASPVTSEAGPVIGVVASFTDVSERKQAEAALIASETRYRALFESSREGIIASGPDGRIASANPAAARMLGYTVDELVGLPAVRLYAHPEQREAVLSDLRAAGHIDQLELPMARKDGSHMYGLASFTIQRDAWGNLVRIEGLFLDITERKRLEEKLLVSERLATLGSFSGSLSHEIRNPLGVIDSSVYYLKARLKDEDDKIQQHLQRISSAVASSTAIIESLLNLTQSKEPDLKQVDLTVVLSESLIMYQMPAGVTLKFALPAEPVWVNADRQQLYMSFENIIKNAVQAMNGLGTLTISLARDEQGWAQVAFADTGPGIAPQHLEKIFQPLFTTKATGMGFGLALARMVAERHHGRIEARSKPGEGTTMIMSFPPVDVFGKV